MVRVVIMRLLFCFIPIFLVPLRPFRGKFLVRLTLVLKKLTFRISSNSSLSVLRLNRRVRLPLILIRVKFRKVRVPATGQWAPPIVVTQKNSLT